ncbi:HD-GYP domain, c-di-GMP phosphodiesterase class II (or its inactivated variant) [Treponema bryantii]|uniref:HD-GYP domain, c-di-GMP phosphodiesterase class II (Or its inactivated variant) n=2 Tax=Treponema bryantii TaxID=163 RepID=A0A1I3JGI8_9SPIR|nr:HD-GYP domain, c-di-GMP phosphodiesterase class II (or its inactivated variant) [Treponema bryantii]
MGNYRKMESININTLRAGITYTSDLLIDSSFLILPKTAEMTDELIKALRQWGFEEVISDGSISLGGDIGVSRADDSENEIQKEKIGENVKKAIESSKHTAVGNSDKARMELVRSVYEEYMNYIESVFTHYATHKEIDQEELSDTVQDLCIFIKEHRRYILRVNSTIQAEDRNFLIIHTMRTTVLCLAIAQQLHLQLSKMVELGVTSILHEIGMLRLPPQLYMTSRKLSVREKAQISKHTLLGYTIIKDLSFGLSIQLGVLEHHEKENGTGYPRRLTGDKISSIAKIIAVACTYEAISSPRSYKDEKSTFDALLELLQNKEHAYDGSVIKALLYTVSLYPIGTYVYLSNRKIAEVIDTNPDNPKTPVVQLLTEKEADGSLKTLQIGENNINILRILTKKEKEDILKLVREKEEKETSKTSPAAPAQEEETLPEVSEINKAEPAPAAAPAPSPEAQPETANTAAPEGDAPAADDGTEEVDISIFG